MTEDRRIPPAALALGLAGLIPFLWSAATQLLPAAAALGDAWLPPALAGVPLAVAYGTVILAFMSGVLWGFAARSPEAGPLPYVLSVIPALWVFFAVTGVSGTDVIVLIAGYLGLLMLDAVFAALGLAPRWWMKLRLLLTAVVVACLSVPLL